MWSVTPGEEGITILDFSVSVEGTNVLSVAGVEVLRDGEVIFPVFPYFESDSPGDYRIEVLDNGVEAVAKDYIQKGLKLNDELPSFDLTPGTPVVFSNSFEWDFGPSPTLLTQASWDIVITDPNGATLTTLSGTGSNINATWDSSVLSDVGRFRLRPKGIGTAPDGGTPIYAYEVKTRAFAYPGGFYQNDSGQFVQAPDAFYETSTAAPDRRLLIRNIRLTPDPPFQEPNSTVTITAEILTVGIEDLDENEIEWSVELFDPSGVYVTAINSGTGFAVSATWDGKVEGEPVLDPSAYTVRVRADLCRASLQPRGIRAQGIDDFCLVAQNDKRLGLLLTIKQLDDTIIATSLGDEKEKERVYGLLEGTDGKKQFKVKLSGNDLPPLVRLKATSLCPVGERAHLR